MIEVKNLNVRIHKTHAVRGVSFTLQPGEKLGIVGESGSGKTLLMKTLIRLLPHNAVIESGSVVYQGKDLTKLSEKELQKIRGKEIGMVFQDPMTSLNPTMKMGAQIAEGYLRHFPASSRNGSERALELLRQVKVPDPELRLEQYPHHLSGGLRQRAMIALALAAAPQVLIADEPTTALDVTVQAQILELLKDLQHSKSTLLVTHDLSLVASFCDRVLVMYQGEIVEEASVYDLFAKPQHPHTQKLLNSIPKIV